MIKTRIQKFLPHLLITRCFGYCAAIKTSWFKNLLIRGFIKLFNIDLQQALIKDIQQYDNFNAFFARALEPGARPIDGNSHTITAPADGYIYHFGTIGEGQFFAVKGYEFTLQDLLVHQNDAQQFTQGQFFCTYLSPRDYHRVHMPIAGRLIKTTYVPGRLFSVDPQLFSVIPNVFALNERLLCLFETELGPMMLIMVGAMNVASMHTAWAGAVNATRSSQVIDTDYSQQHITLAKGEEMGFFQMGSTVILLFPAGQAIFETALKTGEHLLVGELIAQMP